MSSVSVVCPCVSLCVCVFAADDFDRAFNLLVSESLESSRLQAKRAESMSMPINLLKKRRGTPITHHPPHLPPMAQRGEIVGPPVEEIITREGDLIGHVWMVGV